MKSGLVAFRLRDNFVNENKKKIKNILMTFDIMGSSHKSQENWETTRNIK